MAAIAIAFGSVAPLGIYSTRRKIGENPQKQLPKHLREMLAMAECASQSVQISTVAMPFISGILHSRP
jgi:hypothetical protein